MLRKKNISTSGAASIHREVPVAAQESADEFIELTFYNMFWIFVIVSIVGLYVETLVSYPIDDIWKDRAGLIWGPFSPIYGLGALLMTVFFNGMKSKPLRMLFVGCALFGGLFEWCASWVWEKAFGIVAWSYINEPFNIGGRTCLRIMVVWGMAGLLWMKLGLPIVMKIINLIPKSIRGWLTACLTAFMALDVAVTIMGFSCWYDRQIGQPIDTPMEQFFAEHYDDEFMANRFQTMTIFADLAKR